MSTPLPIPKLLVVDDTSANLIAMRRLLRHVDAEIIEAENGEAALGACLDHDFALILLDINMPGMDGFEVASALQDEESTRNIPIIFLTAAYGDDVSRLKGYDAGAVDFITKPVEPAILLSKVKIFLELHQQRYQVEHTLEQLFQLNKELQETKNRLQHVAHHDVLTDLPNRMLFRDRLEQSLARANRDHGTFAVLYVDIDGFKPVNDQLGHAAGDAVLKQIAQRLQQRVRGSDTVARLGGDEFAVIANNIQDAAAALSLGEMLCTVLSEPYALDLPAGTKPPPVGASVGIALFPRHGDQADALLLAADHAMYQAKHGGKSHAVLAESPT